MRRAQIARQRVQIFKPAVDTRYAEDHIVSHSELRIPSEQARGAAELLSQGAQGHRGRRHRRGTVLRRRAAGGLRGAGAPRRSRDRRRARSGLSRQAVRADATAVGGRRIHHQDAGHLHGLRQPGQSHAAAGREHGSRAARRDRHLRGAVPPLLRPDAGHRSPAAEAAVERS